MSFDRSRMVIFLVSIPCGEIQYTAVGFKDCESRGRLEDSTSRGVLSQWSSSDEDRLDLVWEREMLR